MTRVDDEPRLRATPEAWASPGVARPALFWGALLAATALWVGATARTRTDTLGDWGLLPAFPLFWYVAVAAVFALCLQRISADVAGDRRMAASLAVLVVMLRATPSLVADAPRLPWVYKHVAVTRYVETYAGVDPAIDIYHRWPGFFALTAFLHEVAGYDTPIAYVAWSEVAFSLLDVLLVLAVARTISRRPAWYWTAALVFAIGDWVGQNYFAPQALGFTLYLAITLLLLRYFKGEPNALGRRAEALAGRLFQGKAPLRRESWLADEDRTGRAFAVATLFAMTAVVVVSHQLTPYVALLALVPLFLLRYLRPAPVAAAMVILTLVYLYPNIDFIEERFGDLASFDPVANVTQAAPDPALDSAASRWGSLASNALSAAVVLLGLGGMIRRLRQGHVRSSLVVAWLAVAPAVTLLGQTYGGEGKFRVFLFGLPWFAMGVAWLLSPDGDTRTGGRRSFPRTVALTAILSLFVVTYYQSEADYRLAAADVAAAEWLDENVRPQDQILPTTRNFPVAIGPRYHVVAPWDVGALTEFRTCLGEHPIEVGLLKDMIRIRNVPSTGTYVIFSDAMEEYATRHGLIPPGELDELESALFGDPDAELAYSNGSARVYRIDNERLGQSLENGPGIASVEDCVFP